MISDTLLDRYLSVDDFYGITDEYRAIVDVRNHMVRVCAMPDTPPSGRSAARRSGWSRRRTVCSMTAHVRVEAPVVCVMRSPTD
jgi:hypothetical protein